jgi:hypothetical protein
MDGFIGVDLCMFPAALPPDGTVINFDNPESLVTVLISVCVVATVLSIIFTVLRLFANRRRLGLSDCTYNPRERIYPKQFSKAHHHLLDFVAIALVLAITHVALMFPQTKFARHQWDVRACWYNGEYTKVSNLPSQRNMHHILVRHANPIPS